MYVVTYCVVRCVSRELGYTCSRSRSLRGRFVWQSPVRSPAIAAVMSARNAIAKLVISLAPYSGLPVGAIIWLSWILLYLAGPTYVQVRTCSVCLAQISIINHWKQTACEKRCVGVDRLLRPLAICDQYLDQTSGIPLLQNILKDMIHRGDLLGRPEIEYKTYSSSCSQDHIFTSYHHPHAEKNSIQYLARRNPRHKVHLNNLLQI